MDFEGLNLPELMELMHGLEMPELVSWLPGTNGWWVLVVWLAGVGAVVLRQIILFRRRNEYRRQAEKELVMIGEQADENPLMAAERIASLVKRTALAAYPRRRVAALYGADWAAFLRETSRDDPAVTAAADLLASGAYSSSADGRAMVEPALRWIKVHRA